MEKLFHANANKKIAGVAVHISDKTDFKTKVIVTDKEGPHIMINRAIQQKEKTLINIYAPNIGAPKYLKQILTNRKGETDSNSYSQGF